VAGKLAGGGFRGEEPTAAGALFGEAGPAAPSQLITTRQELVYVW
jgi:hypothetical protein